MSPFKRFLGVFVVGIAVFSMFFGGGNLTFPLWVGIESTSPIVSVLGFLVSGVMLPFYGILIGLYFKGDWAKCFSPFGRAVGQILGFSLLLFWIPLGSGPRCNQLAYGAFCQMGWHAPLWLYSLTFSGVVYALTFRKNSFLGILGKVITPVLMFALFFVIFSLFNQDLPVEHSFNWSELTASLRYGYFTQDFIAAIFFSSTIIALLKAQHKKNYNPRFTRNAFLIAISLLSVIYIGMIFVGNMNHEFLQTVPKNELLTAVGNVLFNEKFHIVIFLTITLSVLSTAMALALVFTEYLSKTLFKDKLSYNKSLFVSIALTFVMSTIGFDRLAVVISYAMMMLYPFLLLTTSVAFVKESRERRRKLSKDDSQPILDEGLVDRPTSVS